MQPATLNKLEQIRNFDMMAEQTSTRRILFAFLGAPLIVPLVLCLPLPGESVGTAHVGLTDRLIFPLILAPYALAISYVAELLVGLPAWLVFRHYGVRSLPAFAVTGAFLGWLINVGTAALVGNLATKPLAAMFNFLDDPYISICVVAGASSAVLFRTIAFWGSRRVDNLNPPAPS